MQNSKPTVRAVILAVAIVLTMLPILFIVSTSFKTFKDIALVRFVFTPTLKNYVELFSTEDFFLLIENSLIVALIATCATVAIGSLGAYSLATFRYPRWIDKFILTWLLLVRVLLPIVLVIPLYSIFDVLDLIDTRTALVLAYVTTNLPFAVWMMYDFFASQPREILDAAKVDGCSPFGVFLRVALPLAGPGIAATAIFVCMLCWNDYIFALILTNYRAMTLPVGMARLVQQYNIKWGTICAMATLYVLPIFIFSALVHEQLIKGFTMEQLK